MEHLIEYRVRPVTRYVLTRFESVTDEGGDSGGSIVVGEFDNADRAFVVGNALAKQDMDRPVAQGDVEPKVLWPVHPLHTDRTLGYELNPF